MIATLQYKRTLQYASADGRTMNGLCFRRATSSRLSRLNFELYHDFRPIHFACPQVSLERDGHISQVIVQSVSTGSQVSVQEGLVKFSKNAQSTPWNAQFSPPAANSGYWTSL